VRLAFRSGGVVLASAGCRGSAVLSGGCLVAWGASVGQVRPFTSTALRGTVSAAVRSAVGLVRLRRGRSRIKAGIGLPVRVSASGVAWLCGGLCVDLTASDIQERIGRAERCSLSVACCASRFPAVYPPHHAPDSLAGSEACFAISGRLVVSFKHKFIDKIESATMYYLLHKTQFE